MKRVLFLVEYETSFCTTCSIPRLTGKVNVMMSSLSFIVIYMLSLRYQVEFSDHTIGTVCPNSMVSRNGIPTQQAP